MRNDFNTAQALGYVFGLQRHLQRFLDRFGQKMLKGNAAVLARKGVTLLRTHAGIMGLLAREPQEFFEEQKDLKLKVLGITREEVERFVEMRNEARKAKDFARSDGIRDTLQEMGVQLEDTPRGTRWKVTV